MINPLWLPENKTSQSAIVEVKPGMMVALFAVGLERFKVRQDSKETQDIQRICVSRLLLEYKEETARSKTAPAMNICDCGFVFNAAWPTEIEVIEEVVMTNGCAWQLTQCDNFRILAIPGLYRLHLNDETAIGKAQVYAEEFTVQDIPQGAFSLFFG